MSWISFVDIQIIFTLDNRHGTRNVCKETQNRFAAMSDHKVSIRLDLHLITSPWWLIFCWSLTSVMNTCYEYLSYVVSSFEFMFLWILKHSLWNMNLQWNNPKRVWTKNRFTKKEARKARKTKFRAKPSNVFYQNQTILNESEK